MARIASFLFVVLLVSACGAGGEQTATRAELPRVVLQPADLPRVWTRFDVGRQTVPDAPPEPRADRLRFGRVEGWKARYRRPGSSTTSGPLRIESRADLFGDSEGAGRDYELLADDPTQGAGRRVERHPPPALGDEALAVSFHQGNVRYYVVAWRDDNVVASVFANGFAHSFTLDQALELAGRQARRLARATAQ